MKNLIRFALVSWVVFTIFMAFVSGVDEFRSNLIERLSLMQKADLLSSSDIIDDVLDQGVPDRLFQVDPVFYPQNKVIFQGCTEKGSLCSYYVMQTPDDTIDVWIDNITSNPHCQYWWRYKFQGYPYYFKLWERVTDADLDHNNPNYPLLQSQDWTWKNYLLSSWNQLVTIYFDKIIQNAQYYDFNLLNWVEVYSDLRIWKTIDVTWVTINPSDNKLLINLAEPLVSDYWRIIIKKNTLSDIDWRVIINDQMVWQLANFDGKNQYVIDNINPHLITPTWSINLIWPDATEIIVLFNEEVFEKEWIKYTQMIKVNGKLLASMPSFSDIDVEWNELRIFFKNLIQVGSVTVASWSLVDKVKNDNELISTNWYWDNWAISDVPPMARDDDFTTFEGMSVNWNVLSNDFEFNEWQSLGVPSVTIQPQHWTLSQFLSTWAFTYVPNNWYIGEDTFEYQVWNAVEPSQIWKALVTITVASITSANIQATDDIISLDEDSPKAINASDLTSNDTQELDWLPKRITSITANPSHGLLSRTESNGEITQITYTPNKDYSWTDSFKYQVTNGKKTSVATVTLNINPVNDEPVVTSIDLRMSALTSTAVNVLSFASDADWDVLKVRIKDHPSHWTAVLNADQTITYTHTDANNLSDMFTYWVTDSAWSEHFWSMNITLTLWPCYTGSQLNWSCGSAGWSSSQTKPSANQCACWEFSWTDESGSDWTWNWQCAGANWWWTSSCSANNTSWLWTKVYTNTMSPNWGYISSFDDFRIDAGDCTGNKNRLNDLCALWGHWDALFTTCEPVEWVDYWCINSQEMPSNQCGSSSYYPNQKPYESRHNSSFSSLCNWMHDDGCNPVWTEGPNEFWFGKITDWAYDWVMCQH